MTTVIEGFYFAYLIVPFSLISLLVTVIIGVTIGLIRKELKNEESN